MKVYTSPGKVIITGEMDQRFNIQQGSPIPKKGSSLSIAIVRSI